MVQAIAGELALAVGPLLARMAIAPYNALQLASIKGERVAKFTYDHIHLRSPNPEATAAYYERMFDAQVIRTMQQGKPRIDLKVGGANVFIIEVLPDGKTNPPPRSPYQGLDHFGLSVTGIDTIVAELKAKGAEFTMEPTTIRPGTRIAFLRGPEGVSIELLERTPA